MFTSHLDIIYGATITLAYDDARLYEFVLALIRWLYHARRANLRKPAKWNPQVDAGMSKAATYVVQNLKFRHTLLVVLACFAYLMTETTKGGFFFLLLIVLRVNCECKHIC